MKSLRPILQTLPLLMLLVSCSEIYIPEVDSNKEALVVEGLITDGEGPFIVQLTQAQSYSQEGFFYNNYISDANVSVIDGEGQIFQCTNANFGKYILPLTFRAVTGRTYSLRIITSDGSIYESDAQTLMQAESIDSIYTTYNTKEYLNSENELKFAVGYDVRVNLFKSPSPNNPKSYCRFESEVVVQYNYLYTEINATTLEPEEWFWFVFGWTTNPLDELTNIAETNNHKLCFIPKDAAMYGINTIPSSEVTFYYRLKQYTINEDTYRFYENANKQLSASGKIFDPITSQLHGNLRCTSDPTKIVLGMFEVSSMSRSAYIVKDKISQVPYVEIAPARSRVRYKVNPDHRPTGDPMYDPIPYPSWWYHTN